MKIKNKLLIGLLIGNLAFTNLIANEEEKVVEKGIFNYQESIKYDKLIEKYKNTNIDFKNQTLSIEKIIEKINNLKVIKDSDLKIIDLEIKENLYLVELENNNKTKDNIYAIISNSLETIYIYDKQIIGVDIKNNTSFTFGSIPKKTVSEDSIIMEREAVDLKKLEEAKNNADFILGNKSATKEIVSFVAPFCVHCIEYEKQWEEMIENGYKIYVNLVNLHPEQQTQTLLSIWISSKKTSEMANALKLVNKLSDKGMSEIKKEEIMKTIINDVKNKKAFKDNAELILTKLTNNAKLLHSMIGEVSTPNVFDENGNKLYYPNLIK
jgi:hypothetical protein